MGINELQRAAAVLFAAREVGPKGSADEMKLVCYCLRNRARAGWAGGHWLNVIEEADEHAAHEPLETGPLSIESRPLQILARDIDEIFYSEPPRDDLPLGIVPGDLAELAGRQLFWMFMDRPIRPWFQTNIVRDSRNHPQRTKLGLMMLFE
jgi:hypothetical protein